MDSVIFQGMARELHLKLAGSRLDKVIQPGAGILLLRFWTGQEKCQLIFNAGGRGAYYLTQKKVTAPAKPPRFCQLLRARLRGLLEVRAEPLDRVVHFHFVGAEQDTYDLVFEATSARGNLVLVDSDGCIVDLLFRHEGERKLLPKAEYALPNHPPRQSLLGDRATVVAALCAAENTGKLTTCKLAPFSAALADEVERARGEGQSFEAILARLQGAFSSGEFEPTRLFRQGQTQLLPIPLAHEHLEQETFASLSQLVEADQDADDQEEPQEIRVRLAAVLKKQRKRLAKRLEHIDQERARQADPERFRIIAELLLANLHRTKRGDHAITVEDFYQSPPVQRRIELDSTTTPQANAERYFKLYRKARRSGEHHARRLAETRQEMTWLDDAELALEEAQTADDLYQVQSELEAAGLLKTTRGQLGKRPVAKPEEQLYRATTSGGWPLFWGKNSRTNDYVSRHMTGPQDLWFHAKGMPGAHLVLKCGESTDSVAEEDVLFAASLAAGYSKGKHAGKVEVIVASGRDVKKPKGARPGLVTVDSYRSVMVAPRRLEAD
ncbi:MAG: NFACT family protein [Desulfuromonadales bacterium]